MTDITREQIEAFKGDAEYDLGVAETYNQPTEIEKAMKRIALCNMALGYLDVMPRPIEDAVIGERYVFFSGGEYRCVDSNLDSPVRFNFTARAANCKMRRPL